MTSMLAAALSIALAWACCLGHAVAEPRSGTDGLHAAADAIDPRTEPPAAAPVLPGSGAVTLLGDDPAAAPAHRPAGGAGLRLAQFQLPPGAPRPGDGARDEARDALRRDLRFQYAIGSDSEITYQRNRDLNHGLRDNLLFAAPTAFVLATYRPTDWLDLNVEATFEKQIRINEEDFTTLPNGDVLPKEPRPYSILIDQANVILKNLYDLPLELTIGRRNYEDPRLFLYDAALDGVHLRMKADTFQTEMSWSRENYWDLDLLLQVPKSSVENWILYHEYRGIEDHRLAAYAIARRDRTLVEGRPQLFGVRAHGRPTDRFNYWAELGIARGRNELGELPIRGRAYDLGGTYRFPALPLSPSVTLGYAYGSGDNNDADGEDNAYRQTGLQSNETRFGGVTQFKRYGEAFDPELSNLRVFTLGVGVRPAAGVFFDVVYHRYGLVHIANEFRSASITAEMNNVETRLSRSVGSELDVILGLRNLFGTRLGFEVRAGLFFPGKAYLRDDGTPQSPQIRHADKAISVLAVIIY